MCPSTRSVVSRFAIVAFLCVLFVVSSRFGHVNGQSSRTGNRSQPDNETSADASAQEQCVDKPGHGSLLLGVFSEVQLNPAQGEDVLQCGRDVRTIVRGIEDRELWALKILDTGPHVPSSFVYGNNFWFTASDLCEYVNEAPRLTLTPTRPKRMHADLVTSVSPVRMRHRMLYANTSAGMQVDSHYPMLPIVHIGLCMPASCHDDQVVRYTQAYLSRRELPVQRAFALDMNVIGAKDIYRNESRIVQTTSFRLMVAAIAITAIVIAANIAYCIGTINKRDQTAVDGDAHKPATPNSGLLARIGRCFSIADNAYELFNHKHPERDVAALAGIRAIVCVWVLAFHVCYHSGFTVDNLAQLNIKMEWFAVQPLFQAFLYVDVFFVISSILMVYNFLRNETKRQTVRENTLVQNAGLLLRHVVHRYVRLTPVLVMTMIIGDMVYEYLDESSPFLMNETSDLYCKENWWYNLLYVQNVLPLGIMCESWTWYLACDMQFYVAGLLVLFVYAKAPGFAKSLFVGISVTVVVLSYYITASHGLTYRFDVVMANLNMLYAHPIVRATPFLGGALCGWLLYRRRRTSKPSELTLAPCTTGYAIVYWTMAAAVFVTSIFYTHNRHITVGQCAVLWSVGKFVFGVYIGSIVLMCQWGCGGRLTRVLAHAVFQHVSKLTYSVYMISPVVITAMHGMKEVSTHFDVMQTFTTSIAACVVSYAFAVMLAIFVELPFQKVSDEFVMRRGAKRIPASAT